MLFLLFVAWNLKDPHLLPYRKYETTALLLLSVSGLLICFRQRRGVPRMLGTGLMTTTLFLTLYGEGSFRYHKDLVLNHDLHAAQQLGEHFIVGYATPDAIAPLARNGLIGGIFITRRNIQGKSTEQIRWEIADLQALRRAAGLPPLIITTDQEGGIVSRLSPPLRTMSPLASLIVDGKDHAQILADAETYGQEQGRDLTMSAAYNHGLCNAVLQSLNAGVDLQLIAYDYEKIYDVLYCVNQAAERGLIDKRMMAASRARLARLRLPGK